MFIDPPKSIFEPAPTGHLALLVKLVDLGWQPNTFQGETKVQRQGLFTWELPLKLNSQGRPFLISKTLHLSMHTLDPGESDESVFESLSSWTKEKIQSSENRKFARYAAQTIRTIGAEKDDGRTHRRNAVLT